MNLPCQSNPDAWVSDDAATRRAVKVKCDDCPIKDECFTGAVERREFHGIWGGVDFSKSSPERPKFGKPRPRLMLKPIAHGTNAGYKMHGRRGIKPCHECCLAHQQYRELRRNTGKGTAA